MTPPPDRRPWAVHKRPGERRFPRKTREAIMTRDPWCQIAGPGCTEASTQADHIIPYFVAVALGWEPADYDSADNGQGVCETCHQSKTARESIAAKKYPGASPPANQHTKRKRTRRQHPGITPGATDDQ